MPTFDTRNGYTALSRALIVTINSIMDKSLDCRELHVALCLVHCNATKMQGVIIQKSKSIHKFSALNKFPICVVCPKE